MKPRLRMAALALVVASLALAGCVATPAAPDPDALQAWLVDEPETDAPDLLASAAAGAGPGDAVAAEGDEPFGTTMEFDAPVRLDRIEVTCFGEATISVEADITGRATTQGVGAEGVRCAEGVFVLESPFQGDAATVSKVRVDVYGADIPTAWRATIHGSEG
ncbi:hypothetical protein [Microbacterium rhizophilus]|uniref:hypothetical protein n=1 Tax=Microbacterium rhizophilus TaxID=3138934 RepID=UPI0031EA8502